jgi:hypothetical protein
MQLIAGRMAALRNFEENCRRIGAFPAITLRPLRQRQLRTVRARRRRAFTSVEFSTASDVYCLISRAITIARAAPGDIGAARLRCGK